MLFTCRPCTYLKCFFPCFGFILASNFAITPFIFNSYSLSKWFCRKCPGRSIVTTSVLSTAFIISVYNNTSNAMVGDDTSALFVNNCFFLLSAHAQLFTDSPSLLIARKIIIGNASFFCCSERDGNDLIL